MSACALFCSAGLCAQTPALQMTTLQVSPAFGAQALQSCGIAIGKSGEIYVGLFDSTLRRIDPDGTMTLIAGSPNQVGDTDGSGGAARLYADMGVAVDASNVVYICELSGAIRRVTPDGAVTTIAGMAGPGAYADGTGSAARFNGATGICLDPVSGDLYVADTSNYVIRKVTPAGVVTTIAGQPGVSGFADGGAGAALFTAPGSIACDASGNLFVADFKSAGSTRVGYIRRITPGGSVSTIAGGLASGIEVSVDGAGNIYAAQNDSTVAEVFASGATQIVAGVSNVTGDGDGLGIYSTLSHPVSIAVAPDGTVVVGTWDAIRLGSPVQAQPTAPKFVQLPGLPANASVPDGPLTLSALAVGYPAPTYQWLDNGAPVGGPGPTLVFSNFQASDNGTYTVVATNSAGSVTSPPLTLTHVSTSSNPQAGPQPVITTQPSSQTVSAGSTVTFTVAATGAVTYAWMFNGTGIAGASGPSLTLSDVTQAQSGSYVAAAFNADGAETLSAPANLAVSGSEAEASGSQLTNISARASVGSASQPLVTGFSIAGTGGKTLLVRGVGPTLSNFGVSGFLAQPQLTLLSSGGGVLASDTAWGGGFVLSDLMAQAGAFALPANSADSAIGETLTAGNYTAELGGVGGSTGIALVEVYDCQPSSPARIVNLSARGFVGTGSNALIAGFVVSGGTGETLLVRGIGPSLALFGVTGALSGTQITVSDSSGRQLAADSGWDGSAYLAGIFAEVGAFALAPGSGDSAVIVNLPAGSYTAQLTGTLGGTGIGLLEIYVVP